MFNTIVQLQSDIYDLPQYKDNAGNDIDFNIFFTQEKEDTFLTQLIVQALINKNVAGYISLTYLSQENKIKYFNTEWDYYYHQKMSFSLKNLLNNDISSFFISVNKTFDIEINTVEEFKHFISIHIANDYKKFISYHLNKPYPELVIVYSENDKHAKDFSDFPFVNVKRPSINFLGQGIGNALHHCACHILKKNNLYLYASNNQTVDGLRLWKNLEKNPKFLMLSDTYWGSLTTDRNNLIPIQRQCITI